MKKTTQKESEITKTTPIAEVVGKHPETIPIFMKYGMHCFGCPMAMSETVEQGLAAHGIPADKVVQELNNFIKKKKHGGF